MKHIIFPIFVALVLAGAGARFIGCSRTEHPHDVPAKAAKYHCPMHPTIVSDKPGDCPICGMKLVPLDKTKPAEPVKKTMYRSTMNPNEVSDKPGKDSMGMEMVPFEVTAAGEKTPSGLAIVGITPVARERMGLTFGRVEKRKLVREIRAPARIVPDETRLYHVTVKIDGYVEKLFTATTGEHVKQGEPLLTIYSPILVSAQQEYLNVLKENPALAAAARRRLQLWDITDEQIRRLAESGKVERILTLFAPASGWILERNIAAGHKLTAGEQALVLADLSSVWADADVYQVDASLIQTGATVEVAVGGETFTGKVSFIAPTVDAATRTIKVRVQIPNPDVKLKPEMWATARLKIDLDERLAIPATAVLRTGERAYAFKSSEAGHLMPVEIKLGARADDWFEVLDGLQAGDQVVTSANFLVDSESQLKAALAAMTGAKAGGEAEADPHVGHRR